MILISCSEDQIKWFDKKNSLLEFNCFQFKFNNKISEKNLIIFELIINIF